MAGERSSARQFDIAIVTQGFELGGGVVTVAKWLHAELVAAGHRTMILDLAASAHDDSSRRVFAPRTWVRKSLRRPLEGVSLGHHWGANAVEFEPMRYMRRRELSKFLTRFDVIQVVAGGPALACAVVGAGVPVVLQAATFARWERQPRLHAQPIGRRLLSTGMTALVGWQERRALRSADAVLVWNPEMQQAARLHRRGDVNIAFPGLDVERFTPAPDGWRRNGNILSVCRLADGRKRLDLVVRCYAEMVAKDPSVPRLVLAGQGILPDRITALIHDLGLKSRVTVRSDIPATELPGLYRNASLYLQASLEEGFGLSVVEAMCSGVPVVSTATAGTAMTVVNGKTGYLVPLGHPSLVVSQLASSALAILHSSGSNMSIAARSHAAMSFSSGVALRQFTAVYEKLVRN